MRFGPIKTWLWIPALALYALAATGDAQGAGSKVPPVELEEFAMTPAKSFDDYFGRAVLVEFFAWW